MPVHDRGDALGAEPALGAFVALGNALRGNRFPVEDPYPVSTLVIAEGADTVDPVVFLPVSFTEEFPVALSVFRDNTRHRFTSQIDPDFNNGCRKRSSLHPLSFEEINNIHYRFDANGPVVRSSKKSS